MSRIRLGRTDTEVSSISVGTWGHGGAKSVRGRPVGWSGHDDRQATAALRRAYELGMNHWDTADVYGDGQAESLIGALWEDIPRDDIFLASKVGWDPGPCRHFYDPQQIRRQLARSLSLLRTDRIDLYYFHHCTFGPEDRYLDEAIELFRRFQAEGKIRFIGLSDWKASRVTRYAPRIDPDVVQPYRNVVDDTYRSSGLQKWVEAHDTGVAFFSPLKHGLLTGKHERPPDFGEGDHRSAIPEFQSPEALAHYRHCREELESRFAGQPEPVLHALVGALLADTPTGCALVGLRRPEHAEAAAAAGEPLSSEDARWVRGLYGKSP
jgi:aryl-alcohol dehydrogenase-like predicted oxidoreductase